MRFATATTLLALMLIAPANAQTAGKPEAVSIEISTDADETPAALETRMLKAMKAICGARPDLIPTEVMRSFTACRKTMTIASADPAIRRAFDAARARF